MAFKYRNKLTGRVVSVSEPKEREVELNTPNRLGRKPKPARVRVEVKRRGLLMNLLSDSAKWERVSDDTPLGKPAAKRGPGRPRKAQSTS